MGWLFSITKVNHYHPLYQQPLSLPQPPPSSPTLQSGNFKVDNTKVSPSVLLILVIISLVFFISGLLHLLVRFLFRHSHRDPDDLENVTVLQGQLQQLFHLHDAGVDQSFIDTLPVFIYKAIIGLKNPFDCAVCLCEFEADDKLRLLPDCSHAFHMECIDTWLLSHSTCPLCRGSLLPDFSVNNSCSPIVLVLESGSESSREIVLEREAVPPSDNSVVGTSTQLGCHGEDELNSSCNDLSQKSNEIPAKEDVTVVSVKLGKFRNVDGVASADESSSNNSTVDARRCLSMGSFEYVMDGNSSLKVAIRTHIRKQTSKKSSLPLTPGHKPAMSECDCLDARSTEFYHENNISTGNVVGRSKRESFSISKIWLRSKEKPLLTSKEDSSRQAFSLMLPLHPMSVKDSNVKTTCSSRTISDIEVARWENCGSELDFNEVGSCNSLDTQFKSPSFARRTLLWLVGRQNKVVNSCSLPNV